MAVIRSADYIDNAVLRGRSVEQVTSDGKIARSSCYLDNGVLRMRSQRSDGIVRRHSQYLTAGGVRRWRTSHISSCYGFVWPSALRIVGNCDLFLLGDPRALVLLRSVDVSHQAYWPGAPVQVAAIGVCSRMVGGRFSVGWGEAGNVVTATVDTAARNVVMSITASRALFNYASNRWTFTGFSLSTRLSWVRNPGGAEPVIEFDSIPIPVTIATIPSLAATISDTTQPATDGPSTWLWGPVDPPLFLQQFSSLRPVVC